MHSYILKKIGKGMVNSMYPADVAKIWMPKFKSKDLIDMLTANDRRQLLQKKFRNLAA